MANIVEEAKRINKKFKEAVKEGNVLGMTKEEVAETEAKIKKKKLIRSIKKAAETASVIASPVASGVKAIKSGMRRFNKGGKV
jgi:galactitol-specific phosphotransferase system IIB component